MVTNNHEPTNTEMLEAIQLFSTQIDKRFDRIEMRLDGFEQRLDGLEQRLEKIEKDIVYIKSVMVTKDHLDDKLADIRGDMVVLIRKEDKKMTALIKILQKKKVLTTQETKQILTMEPFPITFING
jgi:predicted  nucleic acid-binding Zn-ribbon protein